MRINDASLPSTAQEGNWLQKKTLGYLNLGEIGERKLRSHCVSSAEPYQWALEGCSLCSQLQEMSFEE